MIIATFIFGILIVIIALCITYFRLTGNNGGCFEYTTTAHERTLMIELLDNLHKVTEKHGIDIIVCGGTWIGAMRNNKIIPWDDDVDIAIKPEDLSKMGPVLEELQNSYGIANNLNCHRTLIRQRNLHFKIFFPKTSKKYVTTFRDYTWPFVDIFFKQSDDCYLDAEKDYPLKKVKLETIEVNVGNREFPDSLREICLDPGFRHRYESNRLSLCPERRCSDVMENYK